jgi:integrase
MPKRLTAATVAKLKPGKTQAWHADRLLPSFGLRVYPTGRKTWGIMRRWDGAKHPTFRLIGEYPEMSLADARAKAREVIADPSAFVAARAPAEPEDKADDTFRALAEQFLAHGRTKRGRELRAATLREYRRALLCHAAPVHAMSVRAIRRGDVAAIIRHVAAQHAVTAARTRAALSRFWSWLLANDLVDANVVQGTETYSTAKRERVLSDDELRALWAATADGSDFALIVRLCLWTGCRRSEAGGMRDSELEDGVWTVPGTRTKNHRPLVLPLPRQALAALAVHRRFVGRDLLFGYGPNGFAGWSKAKERLDAKVGFTSWDLHDLRRSVQTRLAGLGVRDEVINRTLNHAMGPIDQSYNQHRYLKEKGDALQLWADVLDRITGVAPSNVLVAKRAVSS